MKVIRYIDLFCGLGAFHIAFDRNNNKKINYKCVYACDINEDVQKIYEENFSIKPIGDICSINIKELPDFDILCAGFPCQPFSIAGKKKGFDDKKSGNLFFKILEIIDIKFPKILFFENVKNLCSIYEGDTLKIEKMK